MKKLKIKVTKDDEGYWAEQEGVAIEAGETKAAAIGMLFERLTELSAQEILGRLVSNNQDRFNVEIDDSELSESIIDGVVVDNVEGILNEQ